MSAPFPLHMCIFLCKMQRQTAWFMTCNCRLMGVNDTALILTLFLLSWPLGMLSKPSERVAVKAAAARGRLVIPS